MLEVYPQPPLGKFPWPWGHGPPQALLREAAGAWFETGNEWHSSPKGDPLASRMRRSSPEVLRGHTTGWGWAWEAGAGAGASGDEHRERKGGAERRGGSRERSWGKGRRG